MYILYAISTWGIKCECACFNNSCWLPLYHMLCFDVRLRHLQLNPLFEGKSLCTVVNGAAFQLSNPFRHVAIIVKLAEQEDSKVMIKFTDRFQCITTAIGVVICAC